MPDYNSGAEPKPKPREFDFERFDAVQRALLPRAEKFTLAEREHSHLVIMGVLAGLPRTMQMKLRIFLIAIDALSLLMGLSSFGGLPPSKQNTILRLLFDCPLGVIRKGFWGLNALAKMGVYGQADIAAELGYTRGTPRFND